MKPKCRDVTTAKQVRASFRVAITAYRKLQLAFGVRVACSGFYIQSFMKSNSQLK
jgi:hypothetical protein